MNKIITSLLALALTTTFIMAAWNYTGPEDKRMPPGQNYFNYTLGWLAQLNDVSGLADVIEDGGVTPEHPFGYLKVHIVNAIYGCTNGQEFVISKEDQYIKTEFHIDYDPLFEYYPTNNSRIVFAAITTYPTNYPVFTVKDWKSLPLPEVIWTPTNNPGWMFGFTRSWWYENYQDGLPYMHFTNLVHTTRIERNWTNFYYICRDAVPTPTSSRVWMDSYDDIYELLLGATQAQYEFMMNDPLFPSECQGILQDIYERRTRVPDEE